MALKFPTEEDYATQAQYKVIVSDNWKVGEIVQIPAASALKWTKEMPLGEGWYWLKKFDSSRPQCVNVYRREGDSEKESFLRWEEVDSDVDYPIGIGLGEDAQWAGPITEPVD